jgi:hypothetical protein
MEKYSTNSTTKIARNTKNAMTIIFYNTQEKCLHICSEKEKMVKVSLSNENINDYIPNDDILYVENAHFINKKQFQSWLKGDFKLKDSDEIAQRFLGSLDDETNYSVKVTHKKHNDDNEDTYKVVSNKKYIHPANNGSVIISDITTDKYPDGLVFESKWDFKDIDSLGGEEELNKSNIYRHLIKNKKLEIVNEDYLLKNKHKISNYTSSKYSTVEKNLNKILVPPHLKAKSVAESADSVSHNAAIEFVVD